MYGLTLQHQLLPMRIHAFALENGFAPVVGTTGFTSEEIAELKEFSRAQDWVV